VLHYSRIERLARDKYSTSLGLFLSYEETEVLGVCGQGLYSHHFIFFITYKWAQYTTVVQYNRLERLARDKYSTSLGLFLSYEETKVLGVCGQGLYSQDFIFFETNKWAQYTIVLQYIRLEGFARDKYSTALGPF
jgi:hypothetical protein